MWEGSSDWYREIARHGGIVSTFGEQWYRTVIGPVQHGRGEHGLDNALTGQPAADDEDELAAARVDYGELIRSHAVDDPTSRERGADLDQITVPFLSAENWGGQGLHLRGKIEGFLRAASTQKWLEVHGREH